MADREPRKDSGRWRAWAAPALLVVLGAVFYTSTGRDDAHISFWPAHTLAESGRLLNYSGARVEQSSSLLFVLVLAAAARATGALLPTLGAVLSIACGAALADAVRRSLGREDPSTAVLAGLLVATSAYVVYWSFSGMETTLAALTASWLVTALAREGGAAGGRYPRPIAWGALAAFVASRPEGGLVAIALGASLLAAAAAARPLGIVWPPGLPRSKATVWTAGALGSFLLLGAWRWSYFGSFFPQPVLAKSVGLALPSLLGGLSYLGRHLLAPAGAPMTIAAGAGLVRVARGLKRGETVPPIAIVSALFLVSYLAFVAASGGDWMEGGRFLVPAGPAAAVLGAVAVAPLRPRRRALAAAALLVAQLAGVALFAAGRSNGMPLWQAIAAARGRSERFSWFERANRIHARDLGAVDALEAVVDRIRIARPGRVALFSGQMGMVPFHLALERPGQVEVVDMRGLVDRMFTSCPVTGSAPRSSEGLVLGYRAYFEHAREIETRCGRRPPDVVYDLEQDEDEVTAAGYVTAFRAEGGTGEKGQFIAVRPDLAPLVAAGGVARP